MVDFLRTFTNVLISTRENNEKSINPSRQDEKGDVYSVGMLLWEISSGRPPFYVEGERYNVDLIYDIIEGRKETIVPDTPKGYVKIYTGNYNSYINLVTIIAVIYF